MSLDRDSLDSLKIEREKRSKRPISTAIWLLFVAVISGVAGAYWLSREQAIEVRIATAVAYSGTQDHRGAAVLDASGYVVARREATVSSKVTGKIADVLIEEGMVVEEGQILARLDDQTLRPLLVLAETQLEARRTELQEVEVRRAEAQRSLRRVEQLIPDELASEADLDRARSEVEALTARLDALESSIAVADATVRVRIQDIEDLLIRAPFDGVIVSKDAQPGEMISPVSAGGGFTRTGIATLVDMESREIEVDVNESFINRVRPSQETEAVLDAYPDWRIASHVINIVPTADRQKATVRVRIAFDELDPRILPNMGIRVSFLDAETGANGQNAIDGRPIVRVPATAVFRDGTSDFVWRVRDNTVERVAVLTGAERDGQVEVSSGIGTGDAVVAAPVAGLEAGAVVSTQQQ